MGAVDHAKSHYRIHTFPYGVRHRGVLPCDIIHDSPRMRMYEEKEAELDRQDNLDALEKELMSQKPVPHSISSRLEGI